MWTNLLVHVLFENNHMIAVFKPAGLLVQGDRTGDPSLLDLTRAWLKEKYAKPGNVFLGLVHRLDRPVAGVVVFGKTSKGASRLSEQFRGRDVRKIYRALVEKAPDRPAGTLEHFIGGEESPVTISEAPAPGLKPARLHYRVIDGRVLEIELDTGRKHQIRAQLASIGCPIVGDRKYGARSGWRPGEIALLAHEIELKSPTGSERVKITVPGELFSWKP